MSVQTFKHEVKKYSQNEMIITEGSECCGIMVLVQGSTDVLISAQEADKHKPDNEAANACCRVSILQKNSILGIDGFLESVTYTFSYKAREECVVYLFPISSFDDMRHLIKTKGGFGVLLAHTLSTLICDAVEKTKTLQKHIRESRQTIDNLGALFYSIKESRKLSLSPTSATFVTLRNYFEEIRKIDGVVVPENFDGEFVKKTYKEDTSRLFNFSIIDGVKQEFVESVRAMPIPIKQVVFSKSSDFTFLFCKDSSVPGGIVFRGLKSCWVYTYNLFQELYNESEESLFTEVIKMATETKKDGEDRSVTEMCNFSGTLVRETFVFLQKQFNYVANIDTQYFTKLLQTTITPTEGSGGDTMTTSKAADGKTLPPEVTDSLNKILDYSKVEDQIRKDFMKFMTEFRKLEDKAAFPRERRTKVGNLFFQIYKNVYKRMRKEGKRSPLILMFLNFGFMDEHLLEPIQVLTLYKIANSLEENTPDRLFQIYYPTQWLDIIASTKRLPSYNSFGEDYDTAFNELRRAGKVKPEDKQRYFTDPDILIDYEIENLFAPTQRLCYGQLSSYFPVLHSDMVVKDLMSSLLTYDKLEKIVQEILALDFSAFHREIIHQDKETMGDKREFIQKRVLPEMILMPTFGSKSLMWQELGSRKKDTPGRFLLPTFTNEDIQELILSMVGVFRWELCKSMLGPSWSDISKPTLTGSYLDYIQFYRKNGELSDEMKDKITTQMKRFRNNIRDVFVSDYKLWINNESQGSMRLNKVVREIMYRTVPLAHEKRSYLEQQPVFQSMANRFKNLRKKACLEATNRCKKYANANGELPTPLREHVEFFCEL